MVKLRIRTESDDNRRALGVDLRPQNRHREVGIRHILSDNPFDIRDGDGLHPVKIVPTEVEISRIQPIQSEIRSHTFYGLKLFDRIDRKYAFRLLNLIFSDTTLATVINTSDDAI